MIDLKVSREHIDAIDKQIVELFEKRMIESSEVAKYKLETGKPVYDKEREDDKLRNLKSMSSNEFNQRAITELFSQIMSISRKYQYGVLPMTTKLSDFVKADKLPVDEQTKVCYFGVPGTHTQQAMENFFGEEINGISCPTFQSVMEAVEKGEAQYGVLPIENSSTGGITANYDLLLNYTNSIVGQYVNKIDQCLVALPGTRIEDIKTVYSHPQGLLQCSGFLKEHPQMVQVEFSNTAAAAKKVAEDGDKTQAAIAARRAAKEYGLEVLQESIQQEKNNCTRFIVIGKEPIYLPLSPEALKWMPERGEKTSEDHVFDLPSPTMINTLLKPWAKAAGIDKRFSFHTSRHTFATMMLTLGADLYTTSKLLGHADVKMTQVYAKIINQKKDDAVNLVNGLFD